MITNIVSNTARMHSLKETEASNLMKVLSSFVNYSFHFLIFNTVRTDKLFQIVL
jgi:hypothetical protein